MNRIVLPQIEVNDVRSTESAAPSQTGVRRELRELPKLSSVSQIECCTRVMVAVKYGPHAQPPAVPGVPSTLRSACPLRGPPARDNRRTLDAVVLAPERHIGVGSSRLPVQPGGFSGAEVAVPDFGRGR